jgi:hypothetical protein
MTHKTSKLIALVFATALMFPGNNAIAQSEAPEQDDVSKALDSTATQWSFQFAYQSTTWKDDDVNGQPRKSRLDNFVQMRVVAPLTYDKFTILPRLTFRHYENRQTGETGLGNTELFGLIIPKRWDWGSGRMGIGPLVTTAGDKDVSKDEWGYGLGRCCRQLIRKMVLRAASDPVLAIR